MADPNQSTRTQQSAGWTGKPCQTPGCTKARGHGGDCPASCASCGGSVDVKAVTPDLDIQPVRLCVLCRWRIFYGGEEPDAEVDHLRPRPFRL